MSGQIGEVYTAIRRIPKDGQSRFQQTSADEEGKDYKDIEAAVDDWYKFAKSAYSATEEEFFRAHSSTENHYGMISVGSSYRQTINDYKVVIF
jgi:hypothetical protein